MSTILLIARVVLAAVLAAAGMTKVVDIPRFRRALIGFGLRDALARPLSVLLPPLEIVTAALLLSTSFAWPGAVMALGLFLVFAAAIGVNLMRGQTPDCSCFGQLHSAPASWSLFARNVALAGAAALVATAGRDIHGTGAADWLTSPAVVEVGGIILGLVVLGLLGGVAISLKRLTQHQAMLSKRLDALALEAPDEGEAPVERADAAPPAQGLPVGAPAPAFSLPDHKGGVVTLDILRAKGSPVLLVFVSPTCGPCKSLLPVIHVWERDYHDRLTVAIISRGTPAQNQDRIATFEASYLLLQEGSAVSDDYQAPWTPAAILVGDDGRIAAPVATGNEAIRAMVIHAITTGTGRSAGRAAPPPPPITLGTSRFKVGEPAPLFQLPDIDGTPTGTRGFLGRAVLLLFWDPGCRFCEDMLADLAAWEAVAPLESPLLVLIASGDINAIAAQGRSLRARVLVDERFDVPPLFGAQTTPSAVLLDREGRIGSSLAVGARNVLALVGVRHTPAASGTPT